MIPVSYNLLSEYLLEFMFFVSDFYWVIISFMTSVKPHLPSIVQNIAEFFFHFFNAESKIFVSRIKGQKIKCGFCPIAFFQFHNLSKIPQRVPGFVYS